MTLLGPMLAPLGGFRMFVVDPGTEIEQNGQTLTVDDGHAVFRDGDFYLTQADYDLLKESVPEQA